MRIRSLGAAVAALGLVLGTSGPSHAQSNIDFLVGELTQRASQFAAGYNLFGPVQTGRLRTRGKKKVIFASDAPVLSITRTLGEARALNLPPEVLDDYLYGNAQRFFFSKGPR